MILSCNNSFCTAHQLLILDNERQSFVVANPNDQQFCFARFIRNFPVEVFWVVVGNWYFGGPCFVQGLFTKFMHSPYYSKSELYGGVVTVSFSKYLPWQVVHFLQFSTHFSKTCCGPLITSKFLALELPFHSWKIPEITWGKIWTVWQM
jgi:hypothetical protein